MSRCFLSMLLAACCLFSTRLAAEDEKSPRAEEPPPANDNAAVAYWQAMTLMPKSADDPNGPFWNPVTIDSPTCREFFEESRVSMWRLQRAAAMPRCDWDFDASRRPEAYFVLNLRVRNLARLPRFRADFQLRAGKPEEAMEDGLAMYALARHTSQAQSLFLWMTGVSLESQSVEVLAEVVPRLNRVQLFRLARRCEGLPVRPGLREVLQLEKRVYLGWLSRVIEKDSSTEALDTLKAYWWDHLRGSFDDFGDLARKNPDLARKHLEETAVWFDEWIELMPLAQSEFDKRAAELSTRIKNEGTPAATAVLPPFGSIYNALRRVEARRSALQAGVAYLREGEAGLPKFPDPGDGKPFLLEKTATGFDLRSHLSLLPNGPIIVRFGPPSDAK